MQTRAEHLNWCKQRALQYCNLHALDDAFASFISDLGKYDKNPNEWEIIIKLGMTLSMSGKLSTQRQMEEFIKGTN